MKKTAIILGLLILNFQFSIFNSAMAQDAKHELSLSFQGLGLGSMPFYGDVDWEDQPNLSLGFGINYTYWLNERFGLRTGVRLAHFSHNQRVGNLDHTYSPELPLSSLGLPGGSTMALVNLRGTAKTVQEEQTYTFIEVPLLLAMRFNGLFVNVGVSLSKAVDAKSDYSYTDPSCVITSIPELGITPTKPVPMTLAGGTTGSVKNSDMVKPFYCLLDGEVGYNFPIGDASSLALGVFGRFAPIKYKTGNEVELYKLNTDASYNVSQPVTNKMVEKIGYYEVGLSLGINFGLGHGKKKATNNDNKTLTTSDNQPAATDSRYDQMASELEAMKAARQKDEAELKAMKEAQKKAADEMAAMKSAQQKAESELEALKRKQNTLREVAQQKLDVLNATIYFDFDDDKVKPAPEEDEAIKAICEAMKADNKLQTVITGHTDDRGPEKYNMKCGQRRAEALKRYMVSLGAPDANIKCESKGETQPIADNDTREGRAKNRRATVELKIEN